MNTETNAPSAEPYRDRELRLVVLLLALLLGLLITAAAIYLTRAHPALAQPLGVGAAVISALAAVTGAVSHAVRRQ
ncbi:hypothetical protein OH809_10050 [Streptomyces sp. NBC_00873]|uniref:hypothetical protein n=1 Tax=unclassified Streptomyces TaxID=2593676 RepID=UPI003862EAFB|nr:hypothetical protein OH809_10050 [Streptomyces sp. NBC_00873]WTA46993.1 hypothetical protein OH821_33770 [Streptomyces sp. NBC_00842]